MNPLTNPPSSTPDAVLAEAAEPVDPLDALLRQIVGGYFVLTDGHGSVSKWSEPAELLFGRTAEEILGSGFFELLIGGTLPPAGQAWRGFLDAAEPPQVPGTVQLTGRCQDGDDFPLEAVFVPVKLDEGFDFSLFLEDLSFELPMNLMLLRMRQQHPVVVRALRQAIQPEAQPWEGWRTAGTLVILRPLAATPWVEAELKRREEERAAADAETEERLSNHDPGIQGSFTELDDAAAVVARLLSAMERIDELERVAGGLPQQLDEARFESDRRAEQAERDAHALRADVQRALAGVPSELDRHEQQARLERLERARSESEESSNRALAAAESATARVTARLDQLERDRAEAATVADARLTEAVAAAEARAIDAIAESSRRLDERVAELGGGSDQLERLRAEHEEAAQTARNELAETLERLERDRERERETARAELAAALERVEQVQRGADDVREQLSAVTVDRAAAQGLAGEDRRRLEELQSEADALRARVEAIRERDAEQDAQLHAADERHAALTAELAALREASTGVADAGELAALRDAVARHEDAAAELATLREATADLGALRDAVARHDDATADLAALREAVARHDDATADLATLRDAVDRAEAFGSDLGALREAVARHDVAADEVAALRDATSDLPALREAVARQDALAEQIAELQAAPAELAELRRLVAEQQAASAHVAERLAELRAHISEHEVSTGRVTEQDAVDRKVETLVGDAQQQIAALHARIAVLAESGHEVAELRSRLDALNAAGEQLEGLHAEIGGLHARVDELSELRASLDSLARDADLDVLRDRVDGLAGRDELTALHQRLDGLPGHDELTALHQRLDGLPGQDQLTALYERLDGLAAREDLSTFAGRDELAALRAQFEGLTAVEGDGGVARHALNVAEQALERIAQVDRGAGTVLADVRLLRSLVDEANALARGAQETGRADSEELRELIGRITGELDVSRGQAGRAETEALGAREAAAAAAEAAGAAREDAARAREELSATRREVEGQRERANLLAADMERTRDAATAARAAGEGLVERLTAVDQRATALRTELGAGRERLDAVGAQVERLNAGVLEAGTVSEQRAASLRTELGQVRAVAESTARGLDSLRAELFGVRQIVESADQRGEQRIEAMQSELTFALKAVEELKQGLSSAGQAAVIARREAEQARKAAQVVGDGSTERVNEVFQQILGLAAARNAPSRRPATPVAPARPEPVKREPRHGFDDALIPMAILTLEGKFKELNPAFAKLVGYKEHEFMKAAWPSPHDRRDYKDQLEQLRLMGLGELHGVDVSSTYMHGQGLMVPVVGKLTVSRGDDGAPQHLLLEAEDRYTG